MEVVYPDLEFTRPFPGTPASAPLISELETLLLNAPLKSKRTENEEMQIQLKLLLKELSSKKKRKKDKKVKKRTGEESSIRFEIEERIKEVISKEKVAYESFVASAPIRYDAFSITYRVGQQESVQVQASYREQEANIASARSLQPETLRGDYEINFSYDRERNGFHIRYEARDYQNDIQKAKQDFTNRVDKFLEVFQANVFPGLRGFTYLGMGKMWRRDIDAEPEMVDVHEAIHTPDEYETRVLTTWMLDRSLKTGPGKYKR